MNVMNVVLTLSQRRVLHPLLEGKTNTEIAKDLGISPNTVNRHTYEIYLRAQVHSRYELLAQTFERFASPEGIQGRTALVAAGLCQGMSPVAVAKRLGVSRSTVSLEVKKACLTLGMPHGDAFALVRALGLMAHREAAS